MRAATDRPAAQRRMPRRRAGHTTAVTIGGERFYLTANAHDDGSLGEVFIQWGKQGTTGAGLMDIYAVALSVGLQHRVPLADVLASHLDLYFVPNGHTDDPDIPRVRSVADYVARRLAIDWLPYPQRAQLGIFTVDERVTAAQHWLAAEGARMPPSQQDQAVSAWRWDHATSIGAAGPEESSYEPTAAQSPADAHNTDSTALAPPVSGTVRSGSCSGPADAGTRPANGLPV